MEIHTQRMHDWGAQSLCGNKKARDALSRGRYVILSNVAARVSGNNVRAALMTAHESVRREITRRRWPAGESITSAGRNRRVSLGSRKILPHTWEHQWLNLFSALCASFSLCQYMYILRWWCPLPPREMLSDFKRSRTPLSVSYLRSTDNNSLWPLLTFPCVNVKCAPLVYLLLSDLLTSALDHTRRYTYTDRQEVHSTTCSQCSDTKKAPWYLSNNVLCEGDGCHLWNMQIAAVTLHWLLII